MNMKSFTMLVASSMCAASLAYVVPAMADELNNTGAGLNDQLPATLDNNAMGNGVAQGGGLALNNDNSADVDINNGNTTVDQGGPDTATGDDDY